MTARSLPGRDYEQDPPSEYVLKLIDDGNPDGMFLAQAIKAMEHSGFLRGHCIEATHDRSAEL